MVFRPVRNSSDFITPKLACERDNIIAPSAENKTCLRLYFEMEMVAKSFLGGFVSRERPWQRIVTLLNLLDICGVWSSFVPPHA